MTIEAVWPDEYLGSKMLAEAKKQWPITGEGYVLALLMRVRELEAERGWMAKIEEAVKEAHGQHGDDLCWMPADVNKIFAAAGLPMQDVRVLDKPAMRRNCDRYIDVLCEGGPWKSYQELEAENRTLKADLDAAIDTLVDHNVTLADQFKTFGKMAGLLVENARLRKEVADLRE